MIRGLAMPGRGSLVSRLPARRRRTVRTAPDRAFLDAAVRVIAARLLDRRHRRERLVIALVLGDGLKPVEAAAALSLSVAQVVRTVDCFLADVALAAPRATAASRPPGARVTRRAA